MGDIIRFPIERARPPKPEYPSVLPDEVYQERLRRIRAQLEQINTLMKRIRDEQPK